MLASNSANVMSNSGWCDWVGLAGLRCTHCQISQICDEWRCRRGEGIDASIMLIKHWMCGAHCTELERQAVANNNWLQSILDCILCPGQKSSAGGWPGTCLMKGCHRDPVSPPAAAEFNAIRTGPDAANSLEIPFVIFELLKQIQTHPLKLLCRWTKTGQKHKNTLDNFTILPHLPLFALKEV